ncbi:arginine--tRNA ligase [Candidatus Saccharibacteria bacterium]|nr:arginine--tRNA ligase [Candidatus Saccharibacteria bacterium]
MIRQHIATVLQQAVKTKYQLDVPEVEVTLASGEFGDYASNVAFGLAKQLGKAPRAIAAEIADGLSDDVIARAEAAGAGFINFDLTDEALLKRVAGATVIAPTYEGKVVVTEYSDPNPFKVLHVGHLYTTVVGDAISNLIRAASGQVHPVNFGGDIGLHVGKTLWAIIRDFGGENPAKLADIVEADRSEWMAGCYVAGTQAYDADETAKAAIMDLNVRVYKLVDDNDHESALAQIYWTCRGWSYDYFNQFYARIGSSFERYYPESETGPIGLATVKDQLKKGVYSESKGAVVFDGEPYGLHTRVFITSQGLPTYETKDLGGIISKWNDYKFDRSIVITGNDIIEYMKVLLKSVEQFAPELALRTTHITHGNVKLSGGVKMSSRKGNFLRAYDVLDLVSEANASANGNNDDTVMLGAVKYSFLKSRVGSDIVFIPEESVVLDGNSGPYLQYAHARARSILAKSGGLKPQTALGLVGDERALAVKIAEYSDVVDRAVAELLPHYVCTYLYELAQVFNRFYEHNRVLGDERETMRLNLVAWYAGVLKSGLELLGIEAPERL